MIVAIASLQAKSINDFDTKIAEAKEESKRLAPQLERIRKLTKEREEVDRRLAVIASLDRERYFRVALLNDISATTSGELLAHFGQGSRRNSNRNRRCDVFELLDCRLDEQP